MKKLFIILLMVSMLFARGKRTPEIENATIVNIDTILVDGTDTAWTQIFWQPAGTHKSILIEANDPNQAGLGSDSAAVQVVLFQVFDKGSDKSEVYLLNSRAHPDSTGWPNGTDYIINDSLDIADMAQTSLYARTSEANESGNESYAPVYNDTLGAVASTQDGGTAYYALSPDYSPGIILRLVGRLTNAATSTGSRWIIRWYQQKSQPVTTK